MKLTSKESATQQGLVRFFTGEPCKHGHIAERRTRDSYCIACANEVSARWTERNKDQKYAKAAEYRSNNKARINSWHRINRANLKKAAFEAYGNKCACCSETEPDFLTIDHIEGGGIQHRANIKKQFGSIYRWLAARGYPEGFRVLCYNCNCAAGFFGICPHQRKEKFKCE